MYMCMFNVLSEVGNLTNLKFKQDFSKNAAYKKNLHRDIKE